MGAVFTQAIRTGLLDDRRLAAHKASDRNGSARVVSSPHGQARPRPDADAPNWPAAQPPFGVHAVIGGEHHVCRGQRAAVGPFHAGLQPRSRNAGPRKCRHSRSRGPRPPAMATTFAGGRNWPAARWSALAAMMSLVPRQIHVHRRGRLPQDDIDCPSRWRSAKAAGAMTRSRRRPSSVLSVSSLSPVEPVSGSRVAGCATMAQAPFGLISGGRSAGETASKFVTVCGELQETTSQRLAVAIWRRV